MSRAERLANETIRISTIAAIAAIVVLSVIAIWQHVNETPAEAEAKRAAAEAERIAALVAEPRESWFDYESVEFAGVADDQSSLKFRSKADWKQPLDHVIWSDVLWCRDKSAPDQLGGWEYTSSMVDEAYAKQPVNSNTVWLYGGRYKTDTPCRMDSTIVGTREGVSKTQNLQSAPFIVSSG